LKRKIIDDLIKWKTEDNGKPILLTGLKGVGKTYLAYDFAKAFFEYISYINLEHETESHKLFDLKSPALFKERLVSYLHLESEKTVSSRILILDEIGDCIQALKMIQASDISEFIRYVILISSKPIDKQYLDNILQFPVYPLEFDEFLIATGNEWYIEAISTHFNADTKIPDIVHKELLELNQLYLRIGGMPGVINEYLSLSSQINVPEMHSFMTSLYRDNINRNNTESDALKMLQVYDSLTSQLVKENKKFQYKLIRKGTTHSMYKDAIQSLCDYNYVLRCSRISDEQLKNPVNTLNSYEWKSIETNTNFKLYFPDTGIFYTKMQDKLGQSFDKPQLKAILENYVAVSLAAKNYNFAFWESESISKIDFIYLKADTVIPIEVFDSNNTRSKNISVLKQKCCFPYAVKISSKNFEFSNQVKYVPYYAVFCL
jgi:predicted AAA+ superfamily ATPase